MAVIVRIDAAERAIRSVCGAADCVEDLSKNDKLSGIDRRTPSAGRITTTRVNRVTARDIQAVARIKIVSRVCRHHEKAKLRATKIVKIDRTELKDHVVNRPVARKRCIDLRDRAMQ